MDFEKQFRVNVSKQISLKQYDTKTKGPFAGKADAVAATEENVATIQELQYRLFVEQKQSLLIILQAPDAAGKDGLIRKVLGQMNPQGCRTYPFKAPSEIELAHDFLWRVHQCTPARGQVAIFNRSHYEDVLVVRVEGIVPKSVWQRRYRIINEFEKNLIDNGTRILKFYLNISLEEQLDRFRKRLEDPSKHWKLNVSDYAARSKWEAYHQAYETVLEKCNTKSSPWYVIPADNKWFRDAAVSSIVAQALKEMDPQYPKVQVELDEIRSLYDHARSVE